MTFKPDGKKKGEVHFEYRLVKKKVLVAETRVGQQGKRKNSFERSWR